MPNMRIDKRFIIGSIVAVEFAVIVFCGFKLNRFRQQQRSILGISHINPIQKENLIFTPTADLKYFYEPKPDSTITTVPLGLDQPVTVNINADALNDDINYSVTKSADVYRIITLGDSFTYGLGVNTRDNWPKDLDRKLNAACPAKKFEVINLGMEGYDIQYIVHRYLIRGLKYQPDLVIWFESGTGFDRLHEIMLPEINNCVAYEATTSAEKTNPADLNKYYDCWNRATDKLHQKYGFTQLMYQYRAFIDDYLEHQDHSGIIFASFNNLEEQYKSQMRLWVSGRT
jgi:hypothetical protein